MKQQKTNTLAIVSLIAGIGSFFLPIAVSIVAIILGIFAKKQIKESGEDGTGLATAGIVLGAISIAISVIILTVILLFFGAVFTALFAL